MDRHPAPLKSFATLILYSSSSPSATYRRLYEETITIITGTSEEQAVERARELAMTRETEFENKFGETIRWSFERVVDISEIADTIADGAEIYTRHFHDYAAYCAIADSDATEQET